jgi:hypothetical protein
MLLQALIEHGSTRSFEENMIAQSLRLLEDQEVRVRLAVGDVLKVLASRLGIAVYEQTHEVVLKSIKDHFVSLNRHIAWTPVPLPPPHIPSVISHMTITLSNCN